MYGKLTALALFTAAAYLGTSAQAEDLNGWFINGGGGAHYHASFEDVDLGSKESDTGFQINDGTSRRVPAFSSGSSTAAPISPTAQAARCAIPKANMA